jgi:hypothetical protein
MSYLVLTFFLISAFLSTVIYIGYHIHVASLVVQSEKEKATNEMSYWKGYAESSNQYAGGIATQNQKLHEVIIGSYTPQKNVANSSPTPHELTSNAQKHTSDASNVAEVAEMTQQKVDKTQLSRNPVIPDSIKKLYKISTRVGLIAIDRYKDNAVFWADMPSVYSTEANQFTGDTGDENVWVISCQNDTCANYTLTQRSDKKYCSDRCRK